MHNEKDTNISSAKRIINQDAVKHFNTSPRITPRLIEITKETMNTTNGNKQVDTENFPPVVAAHTNNRVQSTRVNSQRGNLEFAANRNGHDKTGCSDIPSHSHLHLYPQIMHHGDGKSRVYDSFDSTRSRSSFSYQPLRDDLNTNNDTEPRIILASSSQYRPKQLSFNPYNVDFEDCHGTKRLAKYSSNRHGLKKGTKLHKFFFSPLRVPHHSLRTVGGISGKGMEERVGCREVKGSSKCIIERTIEDEEIEQRKGLNITDTTANAKQKKDIIGTAVVTSPSCSVSTSIRANTSGLKRIREDDHTDTSSMNLDQIVSHQQQYRACEKDSRQKQMVSVVQDENQRVNLNLKIDTKIHTNMDKIADVCTTPPESKLRKAKKQKRILAENLMASAMRMYSLNQNSTPFSHIIGDNSNFHQAQQQHEKVFDTCEQVSEKLEAFLNREGVERRSFLHTIGLHGNSLNAFLATDRGCICNACDSRNGDNVFIKMGHSKKSKTNIVRTYTMIYFFMERLRLVEGLPKSQDRLKNEEISPSGFVSITSSGGTNYWSLPKVRNPREKTHIGKTGTGVPGNPSFVGNRKVLDHIDAGREIIKSAFTDARAWKTKNADGDDKAILPIASCEFC